MTRDNINVAILIAFLFVLVYGSVGFVFYYVLRPENSLLFWLGFVASVIVYWGAKIFVAWKFNV